MAKTSMKIKQQRKQDVYKRQLLYKEETVPIRWKKLRRTGIFPGKMP